MDEKIKMLIDAKFSFANVVREDGTLHERAERFKQFMFSLRRIPLYQVKNMTKRVCRSVNHEEFNHVLDAQITDKGFFDTDKGYLELGLDNVIDEYGNTCFLSDINPCRRPIG